MMLSMDTCWCPSKWQPQVSRQSTRRVELLYSLIDSRWKYSNGFHSMSFWFGEEVISARTSPHLFFVALSIFGASKSNEGCVATVMPLTGCRNKVCSFLLFYIIFRNFWNLLALKDGNFHKIIGTSQWWLVFLAWAPWSFLVLSVVSTWWCKL